MLGPAWHIIEEGHPGRTTVREVGRFTETFLGGARKSERFGKLMGEAAARRNAAFLDAADVIKVSPVDGIHLEQDAHQALGSEIAGKVLQIYPA